MKRGTIGGISIGGGCVYNAAGVWDTTASQCRELFIIGNCPTVVTKTCTMEARTGNEYPKYDFSGKLWSINSNGLENCGLSYYLDSVVPSIAFTNKLEPRPVFYSLGGLSDKERGKMLNTVCGITTVDRIGVEINLSCPNLGSPGPAYSAETLEESLRVIFEPVDNLTRLKAIGIKLPPYYLPNQFQAVADAIPSEVNFITAINSIPRGIDYDIDNNRATIAPNGGHGGIGGPAILPVSLANVSQWYKLLGSECSIVGCGGVSSGTDVYKHLLAGASAVQIGTALWHEGPSIFPRVNTELEHILSRKGYKRVHDIPVV